MDPEVTEVSEDTTEENPTEETSEDSYPPKVVKDLRKESAAYRERAKIAEARADEMSRALFLARVESTGKLANPDELSFDPALLDEGLEEAVDNLIAQKPYLARKVFGDVGQGQRSNHAAPIDFSTLFT